MFSPGGYEVGVGTIPEENEDEELEDSNSYSTFSDHEIRTEHGDDEEEGDPQSPESVSLNNSHSQVVQDQDDEDERAVSVSTSTSTPQVGVQNRKSAMKFGSQIQQIKDLRDLYKRVNSRLSWAQGVGNSRLQKEESKIVSFLEEDDVVEKKELKVFEKMEKYTGRPSFGSKASLVEQFMNDKMCLDTTVSEMGTDFENLDIEIESVCQDSPGAGYLRSRNRNRYSPRSPSCTADADADAEVDVDVDEDVEPDSPSPYPSEENERTGTRDESIQILAELMKHELESIKQLREKVETAEFNLEVERKAFDKFKKDETAKLTKERNAVGKDSKDYRKLVGEIQPLKNTILEHEDTIEKLNEQLKSSNAEWMKKSNRWNLTKRKLDEKNQELEKKCQELEAEKQSTINKIKSGSKNAMGKPALRRIQFVDDKLKTDTENIRNMGALSKSKNQQQNAKAKAPGYFGGSSTSNQQSTEMPKKPLRSSLKQSKSNSSSNDNTNDSASASPASPPMMHLENFNPYNMLPADENLDPKKLVQTMKMNHADSSHEMDSDVMSKPKTAEGEIERVFPNGTRKLISKSRNFTRTTYKNGDIKEKRSDGSIHYFFAEFGLRHYIYPNGLEMTSYANGQIERKNPDGSLEILFPNGCVKFVRSDGKEEFIFPDNTVYQTDEKGYTVILLPTGQKEVQTDLWKKRIFPDGTTKTIYSDGATETHYPNGRIRIKNSAGELISDTYATETDSTVECQAASS